MPRTFRLKFNRIGPMCYIGHLDMMRYMQKAVMRAELDIRYSEGYHPHQIMSFAYPLGVGMETHGDYFDMDLLSYTISSGKVLFGDEDVIEEAILTEVCSGIMRDLNAVMQEGTEILSVSLVPVKADNAMASVMAASYDVLLDDMTHFTAEKIMNYLSQPEIMVEKEGKKGPVLKNIKEGIYNFALTENGHLYMYVCSGSSLNIKPADIVSSYLRYHQLGEIKIRHIIRLETYRSENGKLVPLGYD